MADGTASLDVGMSVVHDCLLVPVQGELHDDRVLRIQAEVLKRLEAGTVKAVILDLSAVRVLDTFAFGAFASTVRMAVLLGTTAVIVGIQPGVASALVDLDVSFDGIRTAMTLEDAFQQLGAGITRTVAAGESPAVDTRAASAEGDVRDGDI
jgi:rsbT antagonist protein RsbS